MDHPHPIPALIVRVPSALCAFPLAEVIETMRPLPVESLANTPDFIQGVSRIRGAAVPVIQLSALFGEDHRCDSATRFVTLRVGQRCIALAVQSVVGIADLSNQALTGLPPLLKTARTEFIQTLCTLDEEFLAILNTARLVPDSVWRSLAQAKAAR
jgi:purine-binding chemotaxis protein CheW